MKAKDIQELIDFIAKSGLDEVNVETDSFKISIKRQSQVVANVVSTPQPVQTPVVSSPSTPQVTSPTPAETNTSQAAETPKANNNDDTSNYVEIKSPMIGTFYRAPNPDSPAFVNVGDSVQDGGVVCIIEAMKLFNEIESEVSGKIVKVLVENASPVEYDQPLFLVDPNA